MQDKTIKEFIYKFFQPSGGRSIEGAAEVEVTSESIETKIVQTNSIE